MKSRIILGLIFVSLIQGAPSLRACTGIKLKTDDGCVITGRTLEFGTELPVGIMIIPRGNENAASGPDGKAGLKWKSAYAVAGVNTFGQPWLLEALNEKGLGIGAFYLPGFGQYQTAKPGEENRCISQNDFILYLLSTCATVDDAEKAIQNIRVVAANASPNIVTNEVLQAASPLHYRIADASGRAAVVEYTPKGVQVYQNPLGVIANSPTFDWHSLNMHNYVNLRAMDAPPLQFDGKTIQAFGLGSGLHGMPGDFTPPSRFVRAAIFSMSAMPGKTASDGVNQAFHILHLFDIPKGVSGEKSKGEVAYDFTQWTSVSDLRNLRFYFYSYDDCRIRVIDLKAADLSNGKPVTFPFGDKVDYLDMTPSAKQASAGRQ